MKNRTIKDPTYSIYKDGGNVENKAKAAGKDELLKLAKDEADIRFDVEGEIIDILQENYQKERKPGQSFSDWFKSKPIDEIKRLSLKNGGTVNETYGDLIDAYEKGIDVMPGEDLTKYIERIRKSQLLEKVKED